MELLQYSFSDLYINSNKDFYISDEKYANSLKRVEPSDKEEFCEQLFMIMHQTSSYSMNYKGTFFRVENVLSVNGELYCLRRMVRSVHAVIVIAKRADNLGWCDRFRKNNVNFKLAG